jgi:hypothetical protein
MGTNEYIRTKEPRETTGSVRSSLAVFFLFQLYFDASDKAWDVCNWDRLAT